MVQFKMTRWLTLAALFLLTGSKVVQAYDAPQNPRVKYNFNAGWRLQVGDLTGAEATAKTGAKATAKTGAEAPKASNHPQNKKGIEILFGIIQSSSDHQGLGSADFRCSSARDQTG